MFSMSMSSNIDRELARVRVQREQIPLVVAKALTFTAERVRNVEREEIAQTFDRPTTFTSNSLLLKAATPAKLEARVWFRDLGASRKSGGAATHYLEPQVYGGDRPLKRFEKYLQRAGFLPVGFFAVPGEFARLDAHGNMSRGQIVQILSALRALPEAGYLANRSARSAQRKGKRLIDYFVGKPKPSSPMGVWQRTRDGVRPVLIFVRRPLYRAIYDFHGIAKTVSEIEFDAILNRELKRVESAQPARSAA